MYERLGWGHPYPGRNLRGSDFAKRQCDLKKGGFTRETSLNPPHTHTHSALGALANMPVLCLKNHGK